jgi:acetate kinase
MILVANPGSSSRKYALYDDTLQLRAELHIETVGERLAATLHHDQSAINIPLEYSDLAESASHLTTIFRYHHSIEENETIATIGLRIVAPSSYFMSDHIINDEVVAKLQEVREHAPLHVDASLEELRRLREAYPEATVVGVSDSAFHSTKPNYVWNYGIAIHDADQFDIKRFGYHGLSVAAAIDALWDRGKLPPKVVVCHLGSGSSVTGVFHGRSIDTSMGYSPLEGVIMASRSGSIDFGAVKALKKNLQMNDDEIEEYLNRQAGLLGLSGSNDIRELISRETDGNHMAHLALDTLIHSIHKAIGSMIVALNGCDLLVFTGTVGERSAVIRKRIVAHLEFIDFILDGDLNDACTSPEKLTSVSQAAKSRPIIVIPANESLEIAKHAQTLTRTVTL